MSFLFIAFLIGLAGLLKILNVFLSIKPAWNNCNTKPPRDWPTEGVITFKNYSTRYRPGLELVLKNMTCTIQSGEKVSSLSSSIIINLF